MTTATITAVFDSIEAAESAANDLAMRVGGVRGRVHRASDADADTELRDLGIPELDRGAYAEALRRGSAVVSATVPDERLDDAAEVLESRGAVDFDVREAEWRREGWTAQAGPASERLGGGEQVIPLVEERLIVGKREVGRGRVRVRSYAVETPVEEQVSLRDESIHVERRAIDRPITGADDAAFRDRTIEATEIDQEAVIAKTARVIEELVVRKEVEERVEAVRDTVRRTEVEVEDDRTSVRGAMETRTSAAGADVGARKAATSPKPTDPERRR